MKKYISFVPFLLLLLVFSCSTNDESITPVTDSTTDDNSTTDNSSTDDGGDFDTTGYAAYRATMSYEYDKPLEFFVHNNFAVMVGYINSGTPAAVDKLLADHKNITTLIMLDVPGSIDDYSNLIASRKVRDASLHTFVPEGGMIASGGTDFFFSGVSRRITPSTQIGVHSWSDGTKEASEYPVGHEYHQPYIDYYMEMGLTEKESKDFYYFTIYAAPAAGVHWMTAGEIEKYKLELK